MDSLHLLPLCRLRPRLTLNHGGSLRRRLYELAVGLLICQAVSVPTFAQQPLFPSSSLLDATSSERPASDVLAMLPGIAQPIQHVKLSVPVRGLLMAVLVHEGQAVTARQIVAVMDNRVSEAEVRLAAAVDARRAATRETQCQLQLAENLLSRLLEVKRQDAVSELEIDQARGRRDQAEAAVDQAHERSREATIQLELARARLESFNVRAPFAGRVLRIERYPGETVTETDTILTLANLTVLRVALYVPTQWYGRLALGNSYQLTAAAPVNHVVTAKLVSSEPVIDAGTQTFRCVFEIDNSDDQLPAGFAVQLIRPTAVHGSTEDTPLINAKRR